MSLALNKPKLDNLAGDIWKSAERLRGKFKAYEYQNVILPIIVIRRLECVLIDWRERKAADVLAKRPKLTEKELAKLVKELELNPKQCPFSNKTDWTLRKVYEEDPALLEENFRAYVNGFSPNVDDIIEHFDYRATIGKMVKNNRLAPILSQYKELELGPDTISPLEMGYIYEELLRRFSEQSGEEAGDHFTPREVIRLMVELLDIPIPDRHFSIYDPAGGTGGMLSVSKEHLLGRAATPEEKERVEKFLTVHGQELSPTNYAVCQADLLIKNDRQAKVTYGNSLIPHDPHSKEPGDQWPEGKYSFNRRLSNPPFGVTWGGEDGYEAEARKLEKTRYRAGMPRVNDGALLFLQTMLAKMIPPGSPLPSDGERGRGEGSSITFTARVRAAGQEKTVELALAAKDNAAKRFRAAFADADEILSVEWTHRHYVADDEYIPFGEEIEAFLKGEIAQPIIRWEDSPQLGYEILPNKYFYRYQPPTPAKELLAQFWRLEKEAEEMLKGLAQ